MSPTTLRASTGLLVGALVLTGCQITSDTVRCSGTTCSVTLDGEGAQVDVLGTRLSFGGTDDGRASITVGGSSVTCAEGESVSAGRLRLECTDVSSGSVTLSASLG